MSGECGISFSALLAQLHSAQGSAEPYYENRSILYAVPRYKIQIDICCYYMFIYSSISLPLSNYLTHLYLGIAKRFGNTLFQGPVLAINQLLINTHLIMNMRSLFKGCQRYQLKVFFLFLLLWLIMTVNLNPGPCPVAPICY